MNIIRFMILCKHFLKCQIIDEEKNKRKVNIQRFVICTSIFDKEMKIQNQRS